MHDQIPMVHLTPAVFKGHPTSKTPTFLGLGIFDSGRE